MAQPSTAQSLAASDKIDDLRGKLTVLEGTPLGGLNSSLGAMGARKVEQITFDPEVYTKDMVLGGDVMFGPDPVVSAIFGLRRGFLRSDRRVQVYFSHRDDVIQKLLWIDTFAK